MKNITSTMTFCGLLALCGSALAEPAPSHLDQVLQRGELKVCTTGDYKPYTYKAETGEYEGIDIDMARSLAASLGVKVQWVQTTWKTLMPDMVAGKCDRSEEHTSELQSLMRISYAVFCLKKKNTKQRQTE